MTTNSQSQIETIRFKSTQIIGIWDRGYGVDRGYAAGDVRECKVTRIESFE